MTMVHFSLTAIQSPFPIQTFAIFVDCNVLKRLLLKVIWFMQPLSVSQSSEEFWIEKHVAINIWSLSSWPATWAYSSCFWGLVLQITALCPSWLHLLHLALGLFQHLNGGWPILLQCWYGGKFLLKKFPLLWNWLAVNLLFEAWFFLENFFLSFSESWCLVGKAPSAKWSYLMSLHCSWALRIQKFYQSNFWQIFCIL